MRVVERCRTCGSSALDAFLSLGTMALANAFVDPQEADRPEPRFPLEVLRCTACLLVQLSVVVRPDLLFGHYRYASSASAPLLGHFDRLSAIIVERLAAVGRVVVEIGSNDGVLLRRLRARGVHAVGVEPAANLARVANAEGLETVNAFFSQTIAKELANAKGPAAAVVANNVLAHIDDLDDVVGGLDALLDRDGVFIAEVPYLLDLIDRVEYDTIYHEHLSYFALAPLSRLFADRGFELFDVERLAVHGGSVRIFAARRGVRSVTDRLGELARAEESAIGDAAAYVLFAERVVRSRDALRATLASSIAAGRQVAALGATAKGNTLLNYCGLGPREVGFIGDSTPLKHGLLTPGTHIPVVPEQEIVRRRVDDTLLLAWNYADAIVPRYAEYLRGGGRFIHPIPEARFITA